MENTLITMGDLPLYTYYWPARDQSVSRAVIQIVHSMSEHMGRYDEFAAFLNDYGYEVYGHDHPGHGRTGPESGHVPGDAMSHLLGGIQAVKQEIRKRHPDKPVYLFGHSVGSFLAMRSMELDPRGWDALILSAPGIRNSAILQQLTLLTNRFYKKDGGTLPQKILYSLFLQSSRTSVLSGTGRPSWRSRDQAEVAAFQRDPDCGQKMDFEFMRSLANGIAVWYRKEELVRLDKSLPILILAGTGDMVGGFGKGATGLAGSLTKGEMPGVYLRLYEGARHDLLWETSKRETMYDILDFLRLAGKEPI